MPVLKVTNARGQNLPAGVCIDPDNHVDTFIVKVRSSNGIGAERLKDLIQTRHEVVEIQHTENHIIAGFH